MELKPRIPTRASGTDTFRRFVRRWPAAAGFTGLIAVVPASVASLTVPGRLEPLSVIGTAGLWFLGAGVLGGTAIAMQHAFRQPRVVAPLFAAGIVLLVGGILWISIGLLDPGSYDLYTLAVIAPFAVTVVVIVTSTAVLIPAGHRRGVGNMAAVASAAITLWSALT